MENGSPDLRIPIGEVVRRWRESSGWTLTEYANRAGLTKGYVSEVERNVIGQPKSEQLGKLAAPFGLSEWDLIRRRMPADAASATTSEQPTRPLATDRGPSPALAVGASQRRPPPGTTQPAAAGGAVLDEAEEASTASYGSPLLVQAPHDDVLLTVIQLLAEAAHYHEQAARRLYEIQALLVELRHTREE